ncbi:MAG: Lrp/AsnC ligand binding domain-containing protein [Halobacteriovoraceae bacterium]|nr:Lrp/AsnC ligand binding domain-containing protein [Halobacteriovoraceae bacterium]
MEKYEIDNLDLNIIKALRADARRSFLDLAKSLGVSGGTIHQRVDKLTKQGILLGSQFKINPQRLGHEITVLLGIHTNHASDIPKITNKLNLLDEVVEAYYTTGDFALILKAHVKSMEHFYEFLIEKVQKIEGVRATETFMCLKKVIEKDLGLSSVST